MTKRALRLAMEALLSSDHFAASPALAGALDKGGDDSGRNTLLHRRFAGGSLKVVPGEGAAVLVCNHVSYVDALVIGAASPRPIRFVMDHRIFALSPMRLFFRHAKAIPIAPARVDAAMLERAYEAIDAALAEGELVCIFPEGGITRDGSLQPFRPGVQRIVARRPVPVVPMALRGLWGSFFSRSGGQAFSRPIQARRRRGWRTRIELAVGEPVAPQQATPELLQARVQALLDAQAPAQNGAAAAAPAAGTAPRTLGGTE